LSKGYSSVCSFDWRSEKVEKVVNGILFTGVTYATFEILEAP
jgi:hypothetical protein